MVICTALLYNFCPHLFSLFVDVLYNVLNSNLPVLWVANIFSNSWLISLIVLSSALVERVLDFHDQVSGDYLVIPHNTEFPISLNGFCSISVHLELEPGVSSPSRAPVQIPL